MQVPISCLRKQKYNKETALGAKVLSTLFWFLWIDIKNENFEKGMGKTFIKVFPMNTIYHIPNLR